MRDAQISDFGEILLFIVGGILFVAGGLITSWLIRPNRPNAEKLTTYESGEDPVTGSWGQFNIRFYVIAILFILFDVEIVFLFPWSVVLGNKNLIEQTHGLWGWFSLLEMMLFVIILALGLVYAWIKGYLEWVKSEPQKPDYKSKIPIEVYKKYLTQGKQET